MWNITESKKIRVWWGEKAKEKFNKRINKSELEKVEIN